MLAAALAAQPRLLLLDEPSAGAAASEVPVLAHILRRVQASGVSVVLVEPGPQNIVYVSGLTVTVARETEVKKSDVAGHVRADLATGAAKSSALLAVAEQGYALIFRYFSFWHQA